MISNVFLSFSVLYSDLARSASGSILPPLPYEPAERATLHIDLGDTKSYKNPDTDEIEHCVIFGVPGIDEGVYTYRGNLTACSEVIQLLHSGKFKVGYKRLRPQSVQGGSQTSLERLFSQPSQQSLESIPER